jgi:prephenate dehydrogenase
VWIKVIKMQKTDVLDRIKTNTVVIDVGSTKDGICRTADRHKNRGNFVATHPIAGTENYGPLSAIPGLFEGNLLIICDREKSYRS